MPIVVIERSIMDEAGQAYIKKSGCIYCTMKLMNHAYTTLLATKYAMAHTQN